MENFSKIDQKPVLTMGMPVYNEEKNVAEAIESLLAQTFTNFVLIISDNASTDKTQEICEAYAKKDKRIIYIRQQENKGSVFNFSFVAMQAKTPFFMWCSGNDKWHEAFVEKLLPAFNDEEVILSYPDGAMIDIGGKVLEACKDDNTTTHLDRADDRYLYFFRHFRVRSVTNLLYGIWRTEALKKSSLNAQVIYPDMLILYESTLAGKFKMHKEVLFWMKRSVIKSHNDWVRKQYSVVTGKKFTGKENIFLITLLFDWAVIRIPFYKHYHLKVITRIWLSINTAIMIVLYSFIEPGINNILRRALPQNFYLKLKYFYKKLHNL